MKTHANILQGSKEWKSLRARFFTASEAPAMMGASKYQTRDELLSAKKHGTEKEITPHLQKLFDKGHAAEAAIRPVIERIIKQDLYPVTGSIEITENGFDYLNLLASFDGLTMMEDINFEHKLWNEALAEAVRNNDLPESHYWQPEQQMLVSGAEKTIFVVSDGTEENMVYCWYEPVPGRAEQLIAGWKQFAIDLESHEHIESAPKAVAEPSEGLPSVSIRFDGGISVIDNLTVFGEALTSYVERINSEPETDQDFANLEADVKVLKKAEEALDSAENGALSQAESIDAMRRTVAMYRELARSNRLMFEKLVKSKKDQIKADIIQAGNEVLVKHKADLNTSLGGDYMPAMTSGFAEAIKGKRTLDSMRGAVNDRIAAVKIEANAIAETIRANLKLLNENADYKFLFSDLSSIVIKETVDFEALVKVRISEHKQLEAEKEADRLAEAERAEAARLAESSKTPAPAKQADAPLSPSSQAFVDEMEGTPAEEPVDQKPMNKAATKKQAADVAKLKKYISRLNECKVPQLADEQCMNICASIVNQLMTYQDRLDELFPE